MKAITVDDVIFDLEKYYKFHRLLFPPVRSAEANALFEEMRCSLELAREFIEDFPGIDRDAPFYKEMGRIHKEMKK